MKRRKWTRWSVVLLFSIVFLIQIENGALSQATGESNIPQLYFFTNAGCAPCRQVEPILLQMTQQGYPVTKLDTNKYPEWVNRFQIRSTPTVVLYHNNRVLNRHSGYISRQQIQNWFTTAGYRPQQSQSPATRNDPSKPAQTFALNSSTASSRDSRAGRRISDPDEPTMHKGTRIPANDVERVAMDATVRLKVEDPEGISYATGTVIHCHDGEWLVLTCGHVFRDANGKGEITVEYGFGTGRLRSAPGRLFDYNSEARDIGLIVVSAGVDVRPVSLARESFPVNDSDQVFSIGCDHGKDATIRRTRIKRHARYDGVIKYDIFGRPVDGRSGGGLFTAGGQLVGVCNAASVDDDEGIYTSLESIHWQLAKVRLTHLFDDSRMVSQEAPQPFADPNLDQWLSVNATGTNAINLNRGRSGPTSGGDLIPPTPANSAKALDFIQIGSNGTQTVGDEKPSDLEIVMTARRRGEPDSAQSITISNPPAQLLNYFQANAQTRISTIDNSLNQLRREMPPVAWTADSNNQYRGQSPR